MIGYGQVPTINQETGIAGSEPTETLMKTRSGKVIRPNAKNKNKVRHLVTKISMKNALVSMTHVNCFCRSTLVRIWYGTGWILLLKGVAKPLKLEILFIFLETSLLQKKLLLELCV